MEWNELEKLIREDLFIKKSENTAKSYLSDLKAFGFTEKPCRSSIRSAIRRWKETGLTGKTIVRRFAAVRWVLKTYPLEFTADERLNMIAEMQDIPVVDKEQVYATKKQADRVIKEADARTGLCVAMMYYAGLRVSEVARCKVSDWDIQGKRAKSKGVPCLYVPAVSTIRGKKVTTKNKQAKILPIAPELMAAYYRYLPERDSKYDGLLTGQRGEIVERTIRTDVTRACRKLGYPKLHDHSFRHGLASRLAKKGVDAFMIASLMGHKSLSSTQKYIHLDAKDKANSLFKAMGY